MQANTYEVTMPAMGVTLPAWVLPTAGGIALGIVVGALLLFVWPSRGKPGTKTPP